MILIDIIYFTLNAKKVRIKTITTFITIRDLNINKNSTDKYAIISMYFLRKDKNDTCVKTKITRKIHLIDNLQVNMFIENDLLILKMFNIFTFTLSTYIESCKITISLFIKNRLMFKTLPVYSIKAIIVFRILKLIFSYIK